MQSTKHQFFSNNDAFEQTNVKCTTLKAAGLLSCLQMKIASFRMKLK